MLVIILINVTFAGVFEDAGVVSEEALLFQKSSVGTAGGV